LSQNLLEEAEYRDLKSGTWGKERRSGHNEGNCSQWRGVEGGNGKGLVPSLRRRRVVMEKAKTESGGGIYQKERGLRRAGTEKWERQRDGH